MNLQYIQIKGNGVFHAIEEPLTFGGYRTLCGQALPPRDLGRPTKAEPRSIDDYCRACWEVEANNT